MGALKNTWDEVGGAIITEMVTQASKSSAGADGDL